MPLVWLGVLFYVNKSLCINLHPHHPKFSLLWGRWASSTFFNQRPPNQLNRVSTQIFWDILLSDIMLALSGSSQQVLQKDPCLKNTGEVMDNTELVEAMERFDSCACGSATFKSYYFLCGRMNKSLSQGEILLWQETPLIFLKQSYNSAVQMQLHENSKIIIKENPPFVTLTSDIGGTSVPINCLHIQLKRIFL